MELSCFFGYWLCFIINTKSNLKDIPLFILCGVFGVAVNQLFFFHGLNLSSSFQFGYYYVDEPNNGWCFILFYAQRESRHVMKIAGVLLGASGAVLLTLKGGAVGSGDSIIGDLFLIINAMSYALYLVLVKPLMSRYAPITVITWVFTFGLFFVCIFPSTIPDLLQTDFGTIPSEIYLKIVYIIVGVTFFTYLLTIYGLQFLSPTVSSSYIYFQPLLVVLFAFVFSYLNWSADYTNTITFEKITYMILIFLGVYLTSKSSSKKTV